jgi:4-hydroxy-3-polyprenylbenzoate decarboxylase
VRVKFARFDLGNTLLTLPRNPRLRSAAVCGAPAAACRNVPNPGNFQPHPRTNPLRLVPPARDTAAFRGNVRIRPIKLVAAVGPGHTGARPNRLKLLVAITGASGALYAQRLLDNVDAGAHEVHVVLSRYARQVIAAELPGGLRLPAGVREHSLKSMNAPFASGSNPPEAMVVIPCTMGTLGRIAHGYSEDLLLRAADVVLKEKRKLILPANPGFYAGPKTIQDVVDTVVARVLDHLGLPQTLVSRWAEEEE